MSLHSLLLAKSLKALAAILLAGALLIPAIQAASLTKPNIVLILVDDWAWNGTSVRMDDALPNSKMPVVQMPHFERLAREGMKFRNAYSGAPQCSPSRVCIQTGKSAPRTGFTVYLGQTKDTYYDTRKQYQNLPTVPTISDATIDADALTIPEALKPLGYASAHFGKWHMGGDPGDEGYLEHDGNLDNKPGNQRIEGDPKLMFSITKRSIAFMEKQVEAKTPFYLQISHFAMHEGRECLPETRRKYQRLPELQTYYKQTGKTADSIAERQDPATWLAMVEDLDTRIGATLDAIDRLGIKDNTYVVLVADNGYREKYFPGMPQPFHGSKWWVWQGGLRVPMIVRGPGIKAESLFSENVIHYDFLPTFVDWAGGDPNALRDIDGVSLADYLGGKAPEKTFRDRYLYFHYPHYRTSMPHSAIVSGSRKAMHFYERPDIPMLFDLAADERESRNIAAQRPEEHKELYNEMMRYFEQVGARLPKTNPDYDPKVYQETPEYESRLSWGPFEGQRVLEADER